ncbi:fluoride efflux transporter CrcB [Bacteroidales bacterium OttesenSCG-928-C19]|nr:fluoride efflux transporter CrcB [Bacteroidales bacterium OttesenSCG-928-C19]
MLKTIGLIGLGGGIGCIARYLQSLAIKRWWELSFPLGTLSVNLLGSFLIGLLMGFLLRNNTFHSILFPLLVVGFCGGYTTFSSFSYECITMFQLGKYIPALIYMLSSMVFGLLLTMAGFYLGNKI